MIRRYVYSVSYDYAGSIGTYSTNNTQDHDVSRREERAVSLDHRN
jgi:hypothetical protein